MFPYSQRKFWIVMTWILGTLSSVLLILDTNFMLGDIVGNIFHESFTKYIINYNWDEILLSVFLLLLICCYILFNTEEKIEDERIKQLRLEHFQIGVEVCFNFILVITFFYLLRLGIIIRTAVHYFSYVALGFSIAYSMHFSYFTRKIHNWDNANEITENKIYRSKRFKRINVLFILYIILFAWAKAYMI